MKIILVGASGTIGQAIDRELRERHDIVRVGRNSGELQVNIADRASIRRLFEQTGPFDALISAAGNAHFGALEELSAREFAVGLDDKLMGQVNLVLIGREFANDGASFTLTSGVLSEDRYRRIFSSANGRYGSTRDYAQLTYDTLRSLGIHDPALGKLLQLAQP